MMKRNILAIAISAMFVFVMFGCTKQYIQVSELEDFKQVEPSKITKVEIQECSESGVVEKSVCDKTTIQQIYDKFTNIKVLGKSDLACDDNTINYKFYYSNGRMFNASIEDKTLVIDKKRYLIE